MYLNKGEAKSAIFKKAANCLYGSNKATVIDASDKFALITAGV
ncbi:hypothetical protein [Flavobacterium album]|nr:hypothetical protein [Flavobacterium album]